MSPSLPSFQAELQRKTEFCCNRILIGKATSNCSLANWCSGIILQQLYRPKSLLALVLIHFFSAKDCCPSLSQIRDRLLYLAFYFREFDLIPIK
jgi:hypothetical protein